MSSKRKAKKSGPKWRPNNGSYELWQDEMLLAVVEPARCRGYWWWTTWCRDGGDVAGYILSFESAKHAAFKAATGKEPSTRNPPWVYDRARQ